MAFNKNSPQNIVKFLEQRNSFNVSSNLVQKYGQMTTFSTQVLDDWTEDEFAKLPLLTPEEALNHFMKISANLRTLHVVTNHCFEKRVFLFGNFVVRIMPLFDYSRLFEIIREKCVDLEEARIDMNLAGCNKCSVYEDHLISEQFGEDVGDETSEASVNNMIFCIRNILLNNPKLRVLTLKFWKSLTDIFPQEATLPALQELTVDSEGSEEIAGFSLLAKNLTLIDIEDVYVSEMSLSTVLEEILRHKNTLQYLRMCVCIDPANSSELSKLAALQMCTLLKELRIKIFWLFEIQVKGELFFADIIKGCPNLENVYFENITLADETLNELYSLPNYKQVFLTTTFD